MSPRQPLASAATAATLALVVLTAPCWANSHVYRQVLPSTVYIQTSDGSGSGVLIHREQRLVITNAHVVGREDRVDVLFPFMADGSVEMDRGFYSQNYDQLAIGARVVSVDERRDLALIQLSALPSHARAIPLGDPALPGDDVHAIGNPGASGALWIYTPGNVRANYFRRFEGSREEMQVLEINAAINPGDSGGPIVNDEGELVAVSQSYLVEGRLISYGVDVSEIQDFLQDGTDRRDDSPAPRRPREDGEANERDDDRDRQDNRNSLRNRPRNGGAGRDDQGGRNRPRNVLRR